MAQEELFEYELLEISYELLYDYNQVNKTTIVADGDVLVNEGQCIDYDEDGIPKGNSMEEFRLRKKIIFDFYEKWKTEHPHKSVFNINLNVDILIRKESVVEAAEHAAKRSVTTNLSLEIKINRNL